MLIGMKRNEENDEIISYLKPSIEFKTLQINPLFDDIIAMTELTGEVMMMIVLLALRLVCC